MSSHATREKIEFSDGVFDPGVLSCPEMFIAAFIIERIYPTSLKDKCRRNKLLIMNPINIYED